jgi:glucoamylase
MSAALHTSESLEAWVQRQYRRSLAGLLAGISPVHIIKQRPGFAQSVRPRRGSIVASPVLAAYDPDPDYFFHWYRDSALVIDALRVAFQDGIAGPEVFGHLAAFVDFSRELRQLDGRTLLVAPLWRDSVATDFRQYLRAPEELAGVHGEAVDAETRVNPDGSLDISRWARPQHDGPALRALAVLRWQTAALPAPLPAALRAALSQLLRSDLTYILRHAREPCFDIWEEEHGWHYYTLRVSAAALGQAAAWLSTQPAQAASEMARWHTEAQALLGLLDEYWLAAEGYYRSRRLSSGERSAKELDIAVILATLHAGAAHGAHSVQDPRIHATLARLEALFDAAYPINRARGAARGPALGRYAGDQYYSGGAYYFSTFAAAELCYRAAAAAARFPADAAGEAAARSDTSSADPAVLRARGDAFLQTLRAFTPADGQLSEQFDQRTGEQTSAKELGWSYAAFITCAQARATAEQLR